MYPCNRETFDAFARSFQTDVGRSPSLLEQADRLHRQFCRPASVHAPVWEPPIDVVETADTLSVHVALPGVPADSVLVELETDAVTVSARRPFPPSNLLP